MNKYTYFQYIFFLLVSACTGKFDSKESGNINKSQDSILRKPVELPKEFYKHFFGKNDAGNIIIIDLSKINRTLFGSIYTQKKDMPAPVSGRINTDGSFILKGVQVQGETRLVITGYFDTKKSITGNISIIENKKNSKFFLIEDYSHSLQFDLRNVNDSAVFGKYNVSDKITYHFLRDSVSKNQNKIQEIIKDFFFTDVQKVDVKKTFKSEFILKNSTRDISTLVGYNLEKNVSSDILYNDNMILSYAKYYFVYDGEVQASYGTDFLVIDMLNKKQLTLNDIFIKEYTKGVSAIIYNKIKHLGDFSDKEMSNKFDDRNFYVTENFYLTNKGICFYYNPDKKNNYTIVTEEIYLSYEEIRDFLAPDFIFNKYGAS